MTIFGVIWFNKQGNFTGFAHLFLDLPLTGDSPSDQRYGKLQ